MSVAKVIEVSCASKKSFEDAIASGITRVNNSVEQVQGAWIQEQKVMVEKGKIVEYRVNMKVTFIVASPVPAKPVKKK